MWVCLNEGFYSIVDAASDPSCLLVRARRESDIERLFPDAKVVTIAGRDYQFRAEVDREVVAQVIGDTVAGIDYRNFKGSVRDDELHDAYASVWRVMANLQPIPPYSTEPRRGGTKQLF